MLFMLSMRFLKQKSQLSKLSFLTLALLTTLTTQAFADKKPEEGFDYKTLKTAGITPTKVEVLEFFWYACPHCYALDPIIHTWAKKNQTNIDFKQFHVDFGGNSKAQQRLFFGLENLNALPKLHDKLFTAIQQKTLNADDTKQVEDFVSKHTGINSQQLKQGLYSFSTASKINQANKYTQQFNITGVPTIVVNQKYVTSSEMAGGRDEVLKVVDFLVKQEQAKQKKK